MVKALDSHTERLDILENNYNVIFADRLNKLEKKDLPMIYASLHHKSEEGFKNIHKRMDEYGERINTMEKAYTDLLSMINVLKYEDETKSSDT